MLGEEVWVYRNADFRAVVEKNYYLWILQAMCPDLKYHLHLHK
jgi:hypothetical protein